MSSSSQEPPPSGHRYDVRSVTNQFEAKRTEIRPFVRLDGAHRAAYRPDARGKAVSVAGGFSHWSVLKTVKRLTNGMARLRRLSPAREQSRYRRLPAAGQC